MQQLNSKQPRFFLVIRKYGEKPSEKQMTLGRCYDDFKQIIHTLNRSATISIQSDNGVGRKTIISSCGFMDSTKNELEKLHRLLLDNTTNGGNH